MEKFSDHSRSALRSAFSFALSHGHPALRPEHIFYALSRERGSIAEEILAKEEVDSGRIKDAILEKSPTRLTVKQIVLTPAAQRLLERGVLIAHRHSHPYVGTEHLLAGLFEIRDARLSRLFRSLGLQVPSIRQRLLATLENTLRLPDLSASIESITGRTEGELGQQPASSAGVLPALNSFATNLTDARLYRKLDPVIGRDEEIDRLIQILSRRTKNNPVLLGDPGVGKTAIVEGLAKRIAEGDVPDVLRKKQIYALDLGQIVAGTSFRGEFEGRLKQVLAELKATPDTILFIDEIHTLSGAGAAAGSIDAANILKPALARGEMRCIGATTLEEFKKHIESDSALERRLQPIIVQEPTAEKTIAILQGLRSNYERFHGIKISDEAIRAAVELSNRYVPSRFLPDKAIDLIDEAAAAAKVRRRDRTISTIPELERQLAEARRLKDTLLENGQFVQAQTQRQTEGKLLKTLDTERKKQERKVQQLRGSIGRNDIIDIVAKITGVPLAALAVKEKHRLRQLDQQLAKRLIGQPEAVTTIANFIRRSRAGVSDSRRPAGSFLFLGPSGVGKTELARILAEEVFGSPEALIRIDMSEFAESFNLSKLIGAPAGYVGYREGAKLTDSVKQRPYAVVLFDEIEKAHSQVFNLLLQVLEDGRLTDATGKSVNFRNTIIILTSNIGTDSFNHQASLGFQAATRAERLTADHKFKEIADQVSRQLKEKFPPEFINRIDAVTIFHPLDAKTLSKIANIQLTTLASRLQQQGISLSYPLAVARHIATQSFAPDQGARAIRRTIHEQIESPVAQLLLEKTPQQISLSIAGGALIVRSHGNLRATKK